MSYTYEGIQAEVDYRRGELLSGARSARLGRPGRRLRRRAGGRHSADTRKLVRDGTGSRGYDLAA